MSSTREHTSKAINNEDNSQYGHSDTAKIALHDVGDGLSVYSPIDEQFYDGIIHSVNEINIYIIHYDDGNI